MQMPLCQESPAVQRLPSSHGVPLAGAGQSLGQSIKLSPGMHSSSPHLQPSVGRSVAVVVEAVVADLNRRGRRQRDARDRHRRVGRIAGVHCVLAEAPDLRR